MRYDTLFLSRTHREDYRWICRPSYVDDSINTLLRPLFLMIESQQNREFFQTKGLRNFYFFVEKNYCALCYLYFTNRVDMVGRQIYALEGICCPKGDSQIMWNVLPHMILSIYQERRGLHLYVGKAELVQGLFPKTLDISDVRRYIWQENSYAPSILNLVDEMQCAQNMYSFVFGTEQKSFYEGLVERVYNIRDVRVECVKCEEIFAEFVAQDICEVKFYFAKEKGEYTLSLMALAQNGEMIRGYSDAVIFDRNGISLAHLNAVLDDVERKVSKYGFVMEQEPYQVSLKNRRLEFEEHEECLEEYYLLFKRIFCCLSNFDGNAEDFIREEDKMIRQIFQYTRRIYKEYYENNSGKETIYILNLENGLWIFYIEKVANRYYLKGIQIGNDVKRIAWSYRKQLIDKYLLTEGDCSDKFREARDKFMDDTQMSLHPVSAIITSLPDGNFPRLNNVSVYTVMGEGSMFLPTHRKQPLDMPEFSREEQVWEDYVVVPPMFYPRKWCLVRRDFWAMRDKNVKKVPLQSIVNGSCKVKALYKELNEAVKELQK